MSKSWAPAKQHPPSLQFERHLKQPEEAPASYAHAMRVPAYVLSHGVQTSLEAVVPLQPLPEALDGGGAGLHGCGAGLPRALDLHRAAMCFKFWVAG